MTASVVGKRYAKAIFALADESRVLDRVQGDLRDFAAAWRENRELRGVFDNPAFGAEVRGRVLRDVAQAMGLHDHARDLLLLLSDRRRLRHIPEVAEAFEAMAEARSGKVRAEVVSAARLPGGYLAELAKTLGEVVGREVVVAHKVDPHLIGGIVTRIGDRVFDGSVRHGLTQLREELLR
jgi:F-type H+-transporting ATPase subunit delta